jgi:ATP-dependent RNA helicase DeaD
MTGAHKRSRPLQGEANKIILDYGYRQPTQLQVRLIPLILGGKDLYAEVGEQRGKSLAIAISLVFRLKRGHRGVKALVVTESGETATKLVRCIKRIAQIRGSRLDVIMIGFSDLIRKEGRQLSNNPDVVIGTSARIIDHIRRGHVDFSQVELVFADEPQSMRQEYLNDIFFIFSKLPSAKQSVYFSHASEQRDANLIRLLKRPVTLQHGDFSGGPQLIEHKYILARNKTETLKALIIASQMDGVLVVCKAAAACRALEKELNALQLRAVCVAGNMQQSRLGKLLDSFNIGKKSVLLAGFSDLRTIKTDGISSVILYDFPDKAEEYVELGRPAVIGTNCTEIISIITEHQKNELLNLEEIYNMKFKEQEFPKDNEIIKGFLGGIVKKIKQEENPLELEYYKKLVKKNVSLFDRSYLMAYFIRNALKKIQPKKADQTTLFVSVGKNRGVFRQDLVKLFTGAVKLSEDELGEIKILESYSFVDLPAEYAQKAIAALNNSEFKGRKITVNYSRKKTERKPVGARRSRQYR